MFTRFLVSSLALLFAFSCLAEDKKQVEQEELFKKSLANMSYKDLENNGVDYLLAEKFGRSQACFEEMLVREKSRQNPRSTELAVIYYCLGRVHQDRREFQAAVKYFEKALKYAQNQNLDRRFLADLHSFAGAAFRLSGNLEGSLRLKEKAVALAKLSYGKENPRTAVYMVGYAISLRDNKEYKKALSILEKAYKILEEKHGKEKKATKRVYKLLIEWRKNNFDTKLSP